MRWSNACRVGFFLLFGNSLAAAEFAEQRAAMVEEIVADVRVTSEYLGKEALDERVIEVIGRVPRHRFVPAGQRTAAYENRPLPIGHGQTISQPYIVAIMTDLLSLEPGDKVLEVGTGSGYQAAVLAELVERVYTIEIIEPLAKQAAQTLAAHGIDGVEVKVGDGYYGWPEHAPFDAIIVTAGATHIPQPLVRQLAEGGRMIIPVGSRFATQQLVLIEKRTDGVRTRQLMPVVFVPLTGGHDGPPQ